MSTVGTVFSDIFCFFKLNRYAFFEIFRRIYTKIVGKEGISGLFVESKKNCKGDGGKCRKNLTNSERCGIINDTRGNEIALGTENPKRRRISDRGVLKEYHREGIGKELFNRAKKAAKEMGYSFIQVKTVQMGKYKSYDDTNRFYISIGFKEFEVFPTLWDKWNPCQIYVMGI